ncbi:MAG: serine hydrolase [Lentimicrobiaceae bacterium]|jgi:CubicO group peptidase (beta-lactamase class C family)|nr:serine hydrolase [Lentimicrobiaceae bacterium]MCP4911042.1 serine hydrolase [Bacteroidota bacterium]MBT3454006.1 serine hydrolase [Lentimicrobiaceae bacterium]MBT3819124.1 serine hydrolase [Lentimicrobiaceae bacterium]MBT4060552.1 serine hydrolase [Lentimicrobiaceae bacterium]
MKLLFSFVLTIIIFISCSKSDTSKSVNPNSKLYFPLNDGSEWETIDFLSLDWNDNALPNLYDHLETNGTRAFIVLKSGKIVLEKYWGNNILNNSNFDINSMWYWASAGKTLTAALVGIAQQDGYLNINDKTSDYLGKGWTSMSTEKEDLITIKNQLTMTSGLNYNIPDLVCTEPLCLEYKSDAGTQWFYHNAPYTLLEEVVSNSTGINYNLYTDQKIESIIGMDGYWITSGFNNVYWSSARDMARFGLLILNKGNWNGIKILHDENYYNQMVNSSQDLNPSYGYLWWLNGKSSIIFPVLSASFDISLSANAPSDLIVAMGKNGQFVDISPSQSLVVIRMGEAPNENALPIEFHDEMWEKLNLVRNIKN